MKPRILRNPRSKGALLVEMALCSVVLFAVLFGIMELGMVLYGYHSISAAAREGSRWAAVRGSISCLTPAKVANCNADAPAIESYVANLGYFGIHSSSAVAVLWCKPPTGGTVDTTCAATNKPGNLVKVKVSYSTSFGLPMFSSKSITMTSTSNTLITQ